MAKRRFDIKVLEMVKKTGDVKPLRPDGFGITRVEYAQQEGIAKSSAGEILKNAERMGLVKSMDMRLPVRGGTVRVYYIPEKKAKKKK